jgi:hypothetical protein
VNFTSPIWGYGRGYEIGWCHGVAPLSMLDDSYIAHIGSSGSSHTDDLIHDNYLQVNRIKTSGWGQDMLKWVVNVSIYNNAFIDQYNPNYPGSQHSDGIQTDGSHVWIYNNYYENFISYPIYGDFNSNPVDWRIFNNVIVANEAGVDWTAEQAMALGFESTGGAFT